MERGRGKTKGDGEAALEDNDYSTVFNIHIKNITNPPPPRLPPAPPAAVEAEPSQEDSKKGKKGKKKGKTPEPSRPVSAEDMSQEDYKNLAEEQDFRYFVRVVPPSEAAEHIAYTTKAVQWDSDISIGDIMQLDIPRTGDLVPGMLFDGLKLELWESLPGEKSPVGEENSEEDAKIAENEEESSDEPIPRKDKLVAFTEVSLKDLVDSKSNGVKSIEKTSDMESTTRH